jgi:hypothetical protein
MFLSTAALALLAGGTYYYMSRRALAEEAAKNLRLIYMALEWYEMEKGQLPPLTFFPDDPRHDADSLLYILNNYGVTEDMTVCPTAPRALRELGLNYVWNTKLSGRRLHESRERDWMLVEMHALSDRVPPPHLGHYSILYTDGRVERSRIPPPGLRY